MVYASTDSLRLLTICPALDADAASEERDARSKLASNPGTRRSGFAFETNFETLVRLALRLPGAEHLRRSGHNLYEVTNDR
jgi:hypothetical protein